jgi:hypothetical protein
VEFADLVGRILIQRRNVVLVFFRRLQIQNIIEVPNELQIHGEGNVLYVAMSHEHTFVFLVQQFVGLLVGVRLS